MISYNSVLRSLSCLVMFVILAGASANADEKLDTITIKNNGPAASDVPLRLILDREIKPGVYSLLQTSKDERIPQGTLSVEVEGPGKSVAWGVFASLNEGENTFTLDPIDTKIVHRAIAFDGGKEELTIRIHDKLFTTYRINEGPKPFFFPLIGVDGLRYSRAYPMQTIVGEDSDHPHQRSLWFTYGLVNGVDFWSEAKGHGSITETTRKYEGSGYVQQVLRTTNDWLDANGKKLLEDERIMTIWGTKDKRVLDFDVTLKASAGPVEFGDTKEGMFGIRVPSSMDVKAKKGGKITNAEGLEDAATWGKRSAWVDYSGPVDDKTIGITILEHPESFGHPTPWHVRDYGLFAANPFGKHDFGLTKEPTPTRLEAGKSLRFRYRVALHPGDVKAASPKALYGFYAHPPTVEVNK